MFDNLLNQLKKRKNTEVVFNPYSNEDVLNNLRIYLNYLYENNFNEVFLVGEAPGYKGCRITGIPFTSGEVIKSTDFTIFNDFKESIILEKIEKENTAKIVWEYLNEKEYLPILWNSFPFHPFNENNPFSNRAPSYEEINEGRYYLNELINIFKPKIIASIGRKGEQTLKELFPKEKIKYIRHPSYGGKDDFIKGMDEILKL